MVKMNKRLVVTSAIFLALSLLFFGCAAQKMGSMKKSDGIPANIVYQVPDSVEITKVSYGIKAYKNSPRLHMEVTVKNLSKEMKRFRVNILLPEGPAGGGLYPRSTKKVKGVAAGSEFTREFPMYYDKLPSGYMIVVKELN